MSRPGLIARASRRAGLITVASAAAVLLVALPASAHVTVSADDATRGAADAILTFRVPNEEDTAVTTKIDIKFPAKNPIASVKPAPKQGWTVATKTVTFNPPIKTDDGTITQGVGEVTYTATSTANGIPPGDFDSFQILVGPLPDAASVAFPTVQTYSDGKTAAWVQPVTDPGNPPDAPAPLLTLAAGGDAQASASPSSAATPAATAGTAAPAATPDLSGYATASDASTARTLGILGIVVGVVGLAVGGIALARSRRAPSTAVREPDLTHR
ncbi:MAG TPA: YcnI family protein [Kineosporiaceae bacterium]|nr:YcnI family protein [Kineosporiaceae bacterium]